MANNKMLMPLQIERQYSGSLDADYEFNTLNDLKNYATQSALSYSGQILYCKEDDTLYKVNSDKTDVTALGTEDLTGYVKQTDLVANYATKQEVVDGYATKTELQDAIADVEVEISTDENNQLENRENGLFVDSETVTISKADYDALSDEEKNNGKTYFVPDDETTEDGTDLTQFAKVSDLEDGTITVGNSKKLNGLTKDELFAETNNKIKEINNSLNGYYTSEETYVGKWIDTTYDVYRRTINIPIMMPNNTSVDIDVSDYGIDFVCGLRGIAIKHDKSLSQPFPYYNGISYVSCHYNNGKIIVGCNTDFSLYYGRITIEYVKK